MTSQKVSRLRLYKMRVLKYFVENKAQLETNEIIQYTSMAISTFGMYVS